MVFPKSTISASLVNSYNSCPRGFYLTVVKGYQPPKGPALSMGTMWDLMFKSYHEGKDPLEVAKKNLLSKPPTKQELIDFQLSSKIMTEYHKNPVKFVKPQFDVKFSCQLENPETKEVIEYPLFGYLDGMDITPFEVRGIEVKTTSYDSNHEWGYTQQKVDTEVQADIYCYYLFKNHSQVNPEMDYIVFNKKTKEMTRLTTRRTQDDFVKLFNKIKQFVEDVKAEKFEMNPHHPRFCACFNYDKGL